MAASPPFPLLIVGLGNPGTKYANTPHNLGFEVVDRLRERWNVGRSSQKFHGEFSEVLQEVGQNVAKILFLKPQTYMNRSGISVADAANFYKLPPQSILVVSDEIDLPPGVLRLRLSGGTGGHNGLKSVVEFLGSDQFSRLRIGVGRSPHAAPDVHLLAKIGAADRELFTTAVNRAADAAEMIVKVGMEQAMNTFNQKKKDTE
jgi:peptidyl-tRNA hydrolase, PTH1 family